MCGWGCPLGSTGSVFVGLRGGDCGCCLMTMAAGESGLEWPGELLLLLLLWLLFAWSTPQLGPVWEEEVVECGWLAALGGTSSMWPCHMRSSWANNIDGCGPTREAAGVRAAPWSGARTDCRGRAPSATTATAPQTTGSGGAIIPLPTPRD